RETMPKSYTDELAEWVESRAAKKRRRDEAAVAFLAVRADVDMRCEIPHRCVRRKYRIRRMHI
ncbi:TraK family protein, partial [Macrococcoides caseolyticum]|uniref:TraK family protein n=1 Tax=Macrococcoides caseolyticum TaxID=69966 RepID=UPI001E2F908B